MSAHLKDVGVSDLERKIESLLRLCDRLREENEALRMRQAVLLEEKEQLIGRNEIARTRIQSILSRLKQIEHEVE